MKKIIFLILFTWIASTNIFGESLDNTVGIGLGYPYVSLKYGLSTNISIEGRYAFGKGINVYGGRLYYNFNPDDRLVKYIGMEHNYVLFEQEDVSGDGYVGVGFIGVEYFIKNNLSLNMDLGISYSKLSDKTDVSVEGIDYLLNVGVNIYFDSEK
ncbi:MAG: hypothetical protein AB1349_08105 [Elusimicrobiota bacterium]